MKTNEPIKIQRDETIIYGSQLREEYYFFTWKGYCCEETFSYDEIIAIHELTGRMIADKNNLHDVDTWMIFKWVFKSAAFAEVKHCRKCA